MDILMLLQNRGGFKVDLGKSAQENYERFYREFPELEGIATPQINFVKEGDCVEMRDTQTPLFELLGFNTHVSFSLLLESRMNYINEDHGEPF